MECYRVTFVSLNGTETDYAFVVNKQMITVDDVVHQAIFYFNLLLVMIDTFNFQEYHKRANSL